MTSHNLQTLETHIYDDQNFKIIIAISKFPGNNSYSVSSVINVLIVVPEKLI